MLFKISEKPGEPRRSAEDLSMTNGDELDAVLLDEGGHVVLNPANVVLLASHLGLHDFVVDGRVTDLEYGHVRLSWRGGSFSLAGLMDQAMDGYEEKGALCS